MLVLVTHEISKITNKYYCHNAKNINLFQVKQIAFPFKQKIKIIFQWLTYPLFCNNFNIGNNLAANPKKLTSESNYKKC